MEANLQILPVLNTEVLQEKANEFAMKGAVESIKEFYSGYNSPYRKVVDEQLKKVEINTGFALPDIIALINDGLSKEIDLIANEAIAKTFVPMVQRFLSRENKEIKFSEFLKEFVRCMENESKDYDDYCLEMKRNERHGWYDIDISVKDKSYKLTMHEDYETRKDDIKKFQFLSLPYDRSDDRHSRKMSLLVDGVTLEMPFTADILKDPFTSYVARLVLAKSKITIDYDSFSEEMFEHEYHF